MFEWTLGRLDSPPPSPPRPTPSHLRRFRIIHQGGVWHFLHRLNISEAPSIIKQQHSEVFFFLSRHQLSRLHPRRALANGAACVRAPAPALG